MRTIRTTFETALLQGTVLFHKYTVDTGMPAMNFANSTELQLNMPGEHQVWISAELLALGNLKKLGN